VILEAMAGNNKGGATSGTQMLPGFKGGR